MTTSWIIRCKSTGRAVFETFEEKTTRLINTEMYEVVPILEYLQGTNLQNKGRIFDKILLDEYARGSS